MAVNEWSWRQLYAAKIDTSVPFIPSPHWMNITEVHEPWRKGWAVTIPTFWRFKAVVVGWWRAPADDKDIEERWINPHWMDSVSADDISQWDDLSGSAEEEGPFYGAQL